MFLKLKKRQVSAFRMYTYSLSVSTEQQETTRNNKAKQDMTVTYTVSSNVDIQT